MKRLLLFFVTLPILATAQDCKVKKITDEFSKQVRLTTGFMTFNTEKNGKVQISLEADSKEIKMLFSLKDGSCFDDQSTANISFDSSRTKSSQRNSTAMNCDGIFSVIFRNGAYTPVALDKMTRNTIASITLIGTNKQKIEIMLSREEKKLLLEKAACIVKESKALIPASS